MTLISLDHPALRNRTGEGVSIAVIDSGVNPDHPHIDASRITGGIAFTVDGETHDDYVDRLGHGTAVTAAIQEKAPDADIWVVKVFDDALVTSVDTLVNAIDWASENAVQLVNLSLGTPNAHREETLRPAIDRAVSRGTLVVSAAEHDGTRWFPGSMPGAAGVLLDPDSPRDALRAVDGDDRLATPEAIVPFLRHGGKLAASGYPRPIPGVHPDRNLSGISFAVANTTGFLARVFELRGQAPHRPVLRP